MARIIFISCWIGWASVVYRNCRVFSGLGFRIYRISVLDCKCESGGLKKVFNYGNYFVALYNAIKNYLLGFFLKKIVISSPPEISIPPIWTGRFLNGSKKNPTIRPCGEHQIKNITANHQLWLVNKSVITAHWTFHNLMIIRAKITRFQQIAFSLEN